MQVLGAMCKKRKGEREVFKVMQNVLKKFELI